jgi:hypothetical protein
MRAVVACMAAGAAICGGGSIRPKAHAAEPGLLFYLSADRGMTADYSAAGRYEPNFASGVGVIADGARGPGLQCSHTQLLSYWAPGHIYAQRGTLSFFWRSREPVGPTPFPIFRVGYADHSSWDMVWLRIDYNGKPGFDALVTDISLARARVSHAMAEFPRPDEWVHLALSWDETRGIRLYVDGRLAETWDGTALFDAALDQFGPHSRTISPMQVQSAYNFVRGGDIDELRIYDRMLTDDQISGLSRHQIPRLTPRSSRSLVSPDVRDEWRFRYGWSRNSHAPPALPGPSVRIRKVEILDVHDLKRWWWRGTDGIRETTWPGVFNRSRLPGRNDYFQLPDWDCYSLSGKSVTFTMPDEPWNQVEVAGAAWGAFTLDDVTHLFDRPKGHERTSHRLPSSIRGRKLVFTNVEQETPIGELSAYFVGPGLAPPGTGQLSYELTATAVPDNPTLAPLLTFINGRHPDDERATIVAVPRAAPRRERKTTPGGLPIVHVLIPTDYRDTGGPGRSTFSYTWTNLPGALDGIALDLPALSVEPTHGDFVVLNVQVKDPLWPLRNILDISFSVRRHEPHALWLDTRDRVLPDGKSLYLTIASASADFGPAALEGTRLRLIFKERSEALREHVPDRFAQVRDNYANIVEEHPNNRRLTLYTRFETDLTDLLRVAPDHRLAQYYWYDNNKEQPRPRVTLPALPADTPAWAVWQLEALKALGRFVNWYIDNRQIENGEFGGGLSDDGDLTNWWPGTALMGVTPDKIRDSLLREMEAYYEQGLFTNGLSTIQTDELHSYEEGIQVLGQSLLLDYGNPRHIERAMETTRALERITDVNRAGHRHIRSSYFSGTAVATEGVWGWSKPSSFLALHPAMALVEFNGAPRARRWLLELADSLLLHGSDDRRGVPVRATVEFATDRDLPEPSERAWPLLWAAYRWTSKRAYIQPFLDAGPRSLAIVPADGLHTLNVPADWRQQIVDAASSPGANDTLQHVAWQITGETRYLETLYASQVEAAALREYINTEGSLWIDRVSVSHAELQRARLGGIAIVRNAVYPGHAVSWRFASAGAEERVAILVPEASPDRILIRAYNTGERPIAAQMTTWNVEPGTWKLSVGTGDTTTGSNESRTIGLERSGEVPITFPPRAMTNIALTLVSPGVPYWSRPDLGISRDDVTVEGGVMKVTVHSLGAVAAPPSRAVLRDRSGTVLVTAQVPPLEPPSDLYPKTTAVVLEIPAGADWRGGSLALETGGGVPEITRRNNQVRF